MKDKIFDPQPPIEVLSRLTNILLVRWQDDNIGAIITRGRPLTHLLVLIIVIQYCSLLFLLSRPG